MHSSAGCPHSSAFNPTQLKKSNSQAALMLSKWLQCETRRYVSPSCIYDRRDLIIYVQPLVVAQGLQFKKAKRAYEQQIQSHGQAQVSSLYTQFAGASTSAIPPALGPGTTTAGAAAAQLQPIPWWSQIVLFLCCASPPYSNAH
jgi:hypothetical protein